MRALGHLDDYSVDEAVAVTASSDWTARETAPGPRRHGFGKLIAPRALRRLRVADDGRTRGLIGIDARPTTAARE
ncbi:hypothetical protein [Rhodococcus kronopolitis]|uniref:Uncharacterized protein n=1 Tax=Rhodococcus kronopolitis TaxID=1460226 RepID=A0ABV9FVS4_9NOCA